MSKHQGDIGELAFILKAKREGFNVSMPYSAITPYDLILDNGFTLLKIQVKSTKTKHHSGYKFSTGRGRHSKELYSITDVDYFALYLVDHDIFYIVPRYEVNTKTLIVHPDNQEHKYDKYREAWHILK